MSFQIISDGACDLPKSYVEENDIKLVPFYVSFGDEELHKEGSFITVEEFYTKMVENPTVFPKTSLPSVNDYIDSFIPFVKKNIPIICICIDLKISGSYNSARMAREHILDTYENAKIEVIDSTILTASQAVYVKEAVRMRDNGLSFNETYENLQRIKEFGRIHFTVGNVDYLKHGGRIGKLAGFAAGALGLKPLIELRYGDIYPAGVARSRKKSISQILAYTRKYFEESGENPDDFSFCVGYGYSKEEGEEFRKKLAKSLSEYSNVKEEDIDIIQIGATTGVHTGPYALGHGFIKKYDK
ncbi:DegV family protein [Anaerofustis sp. NSJ-163]|uniref:DegV family protein n=1 Tax=Anaerofustis sp. NSJ-163 TaxID=2944391 RepID=UPI00209C37A8|nr:DegV family protein [Anaerofustis sp. NSJ-163]MCO8194338.1 DegV family protein [Anaerofustis sp. NSJ-163]